MKVNYHWSLCILLLLLIHCIDRKSEDVAIPHEKEEVNNGVDKGDIDDIDYIDYILSSASEDAVANWLQYHELNNGIEALKKADFSFLEVDTESLNLLLTEFKDMIPNSLKSKPIDARILALETALLKAQDIFTLNGARKAEKLSALTSLFTSMSNLNLQINKKLEFDQNINTN